MVVILVIKVFGILWGYIWRRVVFQGRSRHLRKAQCQGWPVTGCQQSSGLSGQTVEVHTCWRMVWEEGKERKVSFHDVVELSALDGGIEAAFVGHWGGLGAPREGWATGEGWNSEDMVVLSKIKRFSGNSWHVSLSYTRASVDKLKFLSLFFFRWWKIFQFLLIPLSRLLLLMTFSSGIFAAIRSRSGLL